jgi:hypothetical protein
MSLSTVRDSLGSGANGEHRSLPAKWRSDAEWVTSQVTPALGSAFRQSITSAAVSGADVADELAPS